MDRLSKRRFVIVCHEKVVRIPMEGDEMLQDHGERTQGVVKTLMNPKFHIDLVPGATLVAKSPYRLAPSEMQEWSEQLQELQDKVLEVLRKEKLYAKVACSMGRDWESSLTGLELVPEMTDKKGKLAPRYVGPFEILERIGPIAYRLRLPEELSGVHDTFHVSNLKRYLADASLHVPLDEIKVDKTLRFVEEPVEIMDREVKSLKCSRISLVKVHWNSKRGPEFT
ncbi:hypothetical protein Tco_0586706 [Tanacetum coccineum]